MKITKIGGNARNVHRVAAYCRVSTDKDEQLESFETQRNYYTKLIENHEGWESAGIYADPGRSATSVKHRPRFLEMMEDAKAGKIDIILVKSISRFARNAADCQNYSRELKTYGVEVRFEREGISNMDPQAEFLFSVMSIVAQEESHSISDNVRWTYRKNFQKGIYHMGNNRILGYDMNEEGKLVPNQDAWIIKRIFDDFMSGMTYRSIADDLNAAGAKRMRSKRPFNGDTVIRILHNPAYVGDLHLQKEAPTDYLTKQPMKNVEYETYYVQDEHEGIISREVWNQVKAIFEKEKQEREAGIHRTKGPTHFLYGIVFCAECGSPMVRRTYTNRNKTRYKAWNCRERFRGKNDCKNASIREADLLGEILTSMRDHGIELTGDDEKDIVENVRRVEVGMEEIKIQFRADTGAEEELGATAEDFD